MSVPFHEAVFEDNATRLKVNVTGCDAEGKISSEAFRLNLYAFDVETGGSKFTARLPILEASRLHQYLGSISVVRDSGVARTSRFIEVDPDVLTPDILAALGENPGVFEAVLASDVEAVRSFVELRLDKVDVVAVAYRKAQLLLMKELLGNPDVFSAKQIEWGCAGKEAVWQKFFERNQWIFGYALNYIVGNPHGRKLEQVTSGMSVAGPGKRTDALLRTRGLIQSLCFVEIKTHETGLLKDEYRSGCWRATDELSGAVAQSQGTVQLAVEAIGRSLRVKNPEGFDEGIVHNVVPRAMLVVGSLSEFLNEEGQSHADKFRSFELFRRHLVSPEIITFDELYARAEAIVEAGAASSP